MSKNFERVMEAEGRQLRCLMSADCSYKTNVWWVDDGSAEEGFYRHKWAKHEPEAVNPK